MSPNTLPAGTTILVTGVTGYIGSWVANELLKLGYRVRGAIRNERKGRQLETFFVEKYGPGTFEVSLVPDNTAPGAYRNAMKGCAGIVYLAGGTTGSTDPAVEVDPAVAAINSALVDAAAETSIKRFVYTSSSVAAAMPTMNKEFTYNADLWNESAVAQTYEKPENPRSDRFYVVYAAGKVLSEQAAWRFVREKQPGFVLNTVLPNFAMGPALTEDFSGSTRDFFRGFYNNDEATVKIMQSLGSQYWVNVLDIARIHVAALIYDDVKGERLYAFAEKYSYNGLVDAIAKADPTRADLPPKMADPGPDLSSVESARSLELLRRMGQHGWTGWEETMRASL